MAKSRHSHRKMSPAERTKALLLHYRSRLAKNLMLSPVLHADLDTAYPVTYRYGEKNASYAAGYHTGEDHACPIGSRAVAVSYGRVAYAGWGGSKWGSAYGNQVVITTADGKYDYGHNHLSRIDVRTGDPVTPGMVVGKTGDTGNVTGPHDHFEARVAGGHYGSDVHPILVKMRKAPKGKK